MNELCEYQNVRCNDKKNFNIVGPILIGTLTIDNFVRSFLGTNFVPILVILLPRFTLRGLSISIPLYPFIAFYMVTVPKQTYKRLPIQARINCSVSTICFLRIGRRGVCPVSHNAMCLITDRSYRHKSFWQLISKVLYWQAAVTGACLPAVLCLSLRMSSV